MRQAFLSLQIQPSPSRWPIKRFSEKENTLNYGVSEDDPAPYADNLSSYLYISSLVLSCWLRSDISFLPWQAAKAILWGWAPFICLLLVLSLTSFSSSCWDQKTLPLQSTLSSGGIRLPKRLSFGSPASLRTVQKQSTEAQALWSLLSTLKK